MFELEKSEEVKRLISITKSNSGISGPELAKAHVRLGELIAIHIDLPSEDTTVVAMLRGGVFFAEGLYFGLKCRFQVYDPKNKGFIRPETKYVILADSVINTGKTIDDIWTPDMLVACCVINVNAVSKYADRLYAVRISDNSYVGAPVGRQCGTVGPDTTMRLFNLI